MHRQDRCQASCCPSMCSKNHQKDKRGGPLCPTYTSLPPDPSPPQILDGTPLRYGLPNMSVTKAKFEQKGEQFVERRTNKARGREGGTRGYSSWQLHACQHVWCASKCEQAPRYAVPVALMLLPWLHGLFPLPQKAAKKKLEKLEKRALGWGGFDDALKPQQVWPQACRLRWTADGRAGSGCGGQLCPLPRHCTACGAACLHTAACLVLDTPAFASRPRPQITVILRNMFSPEEFVENPGG